MKISVDSSRVVYLLLSHSEMHEILVFIKFIFTSIANIAADSKIKNVLIKMEKRSRFGDGKLSVYVYGFFIHT